MKIETNFVPPIGGLAVRTATAIWVVALVLAGGVVALWVDAAMIQSQLPESTERLQQLEQRRASIAIPANMPSATDIAAMRSRVATANSLSVTGGPAAKPLLSRAAGAGGRGRRTPPIPRRSGRLRRC